MRIRHVDTKKEMEYQIDEYITQGYRIVTQGETTTKMKKTEYGGLVAHILIFLIFGWWTFFIANVVYAVVKYLMGEEVLIKVR